MNMNGETLEMTDTLRTYKYKVEQTAKGARVTVHGDNLTEVIQDYGLIRKGLMAAGFVD
jgi:hypothetical protein